MGKDSTAEASAYPASSALPMCPQKMVVTNGRKKFKIRDSNCRNTQEELTHFQLPITDEVKLLSS